MVKQEWRTADGLSGSIKSFSFSFAGIVVCEAPNNKLDQFSGVLSWKESRYPLNNEKIILRGCVLRNTSWCFGLVVFAGTSLGWICVPLPVTQISTSHGSAHLKENGAFMKAQHNSGVDFRVQAPRGGRDFDLKVAQVVLMYSEPLTPATSESQGPHDTVWFINPLLNFCFLKPHLNRSCYFLYQTATFEVRENHERRPLVLL